MPARYCGHSIVEVTNTGVKRFCKWEVVRWLLMSCAALCVVCSMLYLNCGATLGSVFLLSKDRVKMKASFSVWILSLSLWLCNILDIFLQLPHSFRNQSALQADLNSGCQSLRERVRISLSVYPLLEMAGRMSIQSLHQLWSTQQLTGWLLTFLLAPTCHRTCWLMIQTPIPIKVNHPLENECTVNKVISWCLNFKQIASS